MWIVGAMHKRLALAATTLALLLIPTVAAHATGNLCGPTVSCGGGAAVNTNLFLLESTITATALTTAHPTKNANAESAIADETVCKGLSYCIVVGLAYGNSWAYGANNDFFIRSTGPNTQNTYWYSAANWQLNTPYNVNVSANGGNSWSVSVGPFSKTILNNGMLNYANYGALDANTDDSCPSGLSVTENDLYWWDDVNGVAIPFSSFPSNSLYTAGDGSSSWVQPYFDVGITAPQSC